jgi:hypothetical protein
MNAYLAILTVLFLLIIALGIWRIGDQLDELRRDLNRLLRS